MGIGELAAMYYLNSEKNRESQNLDTLRRDFNNLANSYSNLKQDNDRLYARNKEIVKKYNDRTGMIREYDHDLMEAYGERNALRNEVTELKKKMAGQERLRAEVVALKKVVADQKAFMLKQNEFVQGAVVKNDNLFAKVASQKDDIECLTNQKAYIEDQLVTTGHQLNQRRYLLEAIRRGVDEIPVEYRIKAIAKSYERYPEVSQASLDKDMPDAMKKEIEMLLTLAMVSESGPKRFEVLELYDRAKKEIREEMAAEREVIDELLDIRSAKVQEAIDRGEDPDKIPSIWKIQSEMKKNLESEAKVSSETNDEENTLRRSM